MEVVKDLHQFGLLKNQCEILKHLPGHEGHFGLIGQFRKTYTAQRVLSLFSLQS